MNDPQLVAELRSSSPDALPDLVDAYGDRLFSFCWCLLRNRENAQIAVRDALIAAVAQAGRLARDEWLGPWLYFLARAECRLRAAVPARDADEPMPRLRRHKADSRLMAWNAVASLYPHEVEALELSCRHGVDLSLVLGLTPAEVGVLLDRARQNLERALAAEILIRKSHACAFRAEVLAGWTGVTTPSIRDRILEHAPTCPACGPHLPRSVSPARVFAQLPSPELSSLARLEILEFFDDPRMSAYREFAASRAAEVTGSAFLIDPTRALAHLRGQFSPALDSGAAEPASGPASSGQASSGPGRAPSFARPAPVAAGQPVRSRPAVAQGFIGSWDPDGSVPAPVLRAPAPAGRGAAVAPRLAVVPAPRLSRHAQPAARPASPPPAGAVRPPVAAAPQAAAPSSPAAPAEPPGVAPEPSVARQEPLLAIPAEAAVVAGALSAAAGSDPAAALSSDQAPPVASQRAPSQPAASQRLRARGAGRTRTRHRFRVAGLGTAAVAAATVTAAIAFVGLRVLPTGGPGNPAVSASQPGSAAAQSEGGQFVAVPVEGTPPASAQASTPTYRDTAAARAESLAVTATQPGTSAAGSPASIVERQSASATPDGPGTVLAVPDATPTGTASAGGTPDPAGTLEVTPGQLALGRGSAGQIILTADGGPVSWSASTSSGLLTLSGQQGTLPAGQSVTLTVTVNKRAGRGGRASVVIDWSPVTPAAAAVPATAPDSSQAVQVSWSADASSGPTPSPSDSDPGSASAPPSGAPSAAASSDVGQ